MIIDLLTLMAAKGAVGMVFVALEAFGFMVAWNGVAANILGAAHMAYADAFGLSLGFVALTSALYPLLSRKTPAVLGL